MYRQLVADDEGEPDYIKWEGLEIRNRTTVPLIRGYRLQHCKGLMCVRAELWGSL